jgi:hypothetical protein
VNLLRGGIAGLATAILPAQADVSARPPRHRTSTLVTNAG